MKSVYLLLCLLISISSVIFAPACEAPPVTINDFHASPATINQGQASTLIWDVTGVSRVTLNNGIGEVVPTGKAIVTPEATTKYVLTAMRGKQPLTREVTVTVNAEAKSGQQGQTTVPANTVQNQEIKVKGVPATLKYDSMNGTNDDLLSNQIAVWHTYAKMAGASSAATSFYSNSTRGGTSTLGSAGTAVKSPLLILPDSEGMVCIVRNYAQVSYRYFNIVTTWYGDSTDEAAHLAQPGYGLATVFSPEKTPFKIQKINIAAVANNSGTPDEYEQYHFIVRVLDGKNSQVWSKTVPWSYFKSTETADTPAAAWKSIPVDDLTVNGDFTVEVLSESNDYSIGRIKSFHYLALAYEKVTDKDAETRSYISENGIKSDSWVKLYDAYGHIRNFNLCIRVEGYYPDK
jgi:hypothetical protein